LFLLRVNWSTSHVVVIIYWYSSKADGNQLSIASAFYHLQAIFAYLYINKK